MHWYDFPSELLEHFPNDGWLRDRPPARAWTTRSGPGGRMDKEDYWCFDDKREHADAQIDFVGWINGVALKGVEHAISVARRKKAHYFWHDGSWNPGHIYFFRVSIQDGEVRCTAWDFEKPVAAV